MRSRNGRAFHWWLVPAIAAFLAGAASNTLAAAPQLMIASPELGNVFTVGQDVNFRVTIDGSEPNDLLKWTLYDFAGNPAAHGRMTVSGTDASLTTTPPHPGYFELTVELDRQGSPVAESKASLALLMAAPSARVIKNHFGVVTHFAQGWDTDIMPLIARAGIVDIRDEQYWGHVETAPGKFVFPESFRHYMAQAARFGLNPFIPLTFANPLYDGGLTPFSPTGVAAYGRYAEAVLRQYGRQISAVEIWNEFNGGTFVKGPVERDRPLFYTKLLARAYRDIKSVRPDVTVVGGVTVEVPLPYLEELFRHGALQYMDALSIHPYDEFPEGTGAEVQRLKALMAQFNGGTPKPIWATEIGKIEDADTAAARRDVARYLVRQATILVSEGVDRIYCYLLRDYDGFVTMGLLRGPQSPYGRYAPAPAYPAYATLVRELASATFVRREDTDPRTRIYVFNRNGQEMRVAWVTDEIWGDAHASVPVDLKAPGPLRLTTIDGASRIDHPRDGVVTVALMRSPIYIEGPVVAVTEHRSDAVITDSSAAFSGDDGRNGWSYGYVVPEQIHTGTLPLQPLEWREDDWSHYWGSNKAPYLQIRRSKAQPGMVNGGPAWAVRQWRSNMAGVITVSGCVTRPADVGTGTEVQISVDGRKVYTADLGGPGRPKSAIFSFETKVIPGSLIAFSLLPMPGKKLDLNSDTTSFHLILTRRADKQAGNRPPVSVR